MIIAIIMMLSDFYTYCIQGLMRICLEKQLETSCLRTQNTPKNKNEENSMQGRKLK